MTEAARPVEAQYTASRRRLALVGVVWLMSGCVLVGCGGSPAEPAATTPARPSPTVTSPTPPPSEASSRPSAASWSGSGPSFGADRVRWPGTLDGARQVLAKMPKTLGGKAGEVFYTSGDRDDPARDAGVGYGSLGSVAVFEEYTTDDTASGKPAVMSASSLLSASFGLMYGCAKGTYHGTAPHPMYPHGGPGMSEHPLKRPTWFSCRIDGAEGDESFSGYAVGWTSKKTAWLVVAKDEKTARLLVAALHEAAG